MPRRQKRYNPNIPWGLFFSDTAASVEMPTGWTHAAITLASLATARGSLSAQYDINSKHGLISQWWRWRANLEYASAVTAGQITQLHIAGADDSSSSHIDGGFAATATDLDSVAKVAQLANCDNFGSVEGFGLTTGIVSSGLVRIMDRYISLGINNASGVAMASGAGVSWIKMWPVPEIETP